jgi:hypothetical protein
VGRIDYETAAGVTEYLEQRLADAVRDDAEMSRRAVLGGLGLAGASALGLTGTGAADTGHDDGSTHGNFGARARSLNHEYDENEEVQELVMVMNGFDTNFDGDNEVYAANTRAFAYGVGDTDGKGNWEIASMVRQSSGRVAPSGFTHRATRPPRGNPRRTRPT